MHEIGIIQNILATVLERARAAKASRIVRINLAIGEYSGLTHESISLYFDSFSERSIAARAVLSIRHVPARMVCNACGRIYAASHPSWRCPACRSVAGELISGHECVVEGIEIE
ncbi:MAG: hydrogenase maturation nickel metallochaperone HypA [Chloroflexi bacterium]|nr:hydrogenase maturation nickel metallochaperone HypA [Chloroflexota bacterium]